VSLLAHLVFTYEFRQQLFRRRKIEALSFVHSPSDVIFFHSLHVLARLFFDSNIASFMLAQHWVLFDCCVLLILLPRRKKSTNDLLPLLLQLPKLPYSTTNLKNDSYTSIWCFSTSLFTAAMKLCVEQVPTSRRQSWLIGVLDLGCYIRGCTVT